MMPVYAPQDYRQLFRGFRDGQSREEFLAQFADRGYQDYFSGLLDVLLKNMIIIPEGVDDEAERQKHLSKIRPPYIHNIYFLLTDDCNFACRYCFVREPMPDDQKSIYMSMETARKGLDLYVRLINRDPELLEQEKGIIFYGGEPLMNYAVLKQTIELIAQYKEQGKLPGHLKLLMVTNGSLMTDERARFLKKHDVTVTFSLDGREEDNRHRIFRNGKPAFRSIVRGLRICQRNDLDMNIACTLTPQNLTHADETIISFTRDYRVRRMGFNMLLDNDIMSVEPEYNREASEFIVKAHQVFREEGIRENRIHRKLNAFEHGNVYLYDCMAAGGRQMAIAPDGEIGICHEHLWDRHHFISHVEDPDFDPATNPVYMEWAQRTPLNIKKCQGCEALGVCGGGCLVNSEHRGGIWEVDERLCVQSKTILRWMIWDLYENSREQEEVT